MFAGPRDKRRLASHVQQPAITLTCRTIRNELLPHFYGSHTFLLRDVGSAPTGMIKWIRAIGPANYFHIKKLFLLSVFNDTRGYLKKAFDDGAFPFVVQGSEILAGSLHI